MLNVQILADSPQLNTFSKVSSISFIPGETPIINFQLLGPDGVTRFIPPTTAVVSVGFKKNDGTTLTKSATGTFPSDDRSMWNVSLTAAESAVVIGQNIIVSVDMLNDQSDIRQAVGNNVLSLTFFEGDC
jgi:hypothetical protein